MDNILKYNFYNKSEDHVFKFKEYNGNILLNQVMEWLRYKRLENPDSEEITVKLEDFFNECSVDRDKFFTYYKEKDVTKIAKNFDIVIQNDTITFKNFKNNENLTEKIKFEYLSELEKKAWNFAKESHKDQIRKFGGEKYFKAHVINVWKLIKKYDNREHLCVAALLHDVVEDNDDITINDIRRNFGLKVANLVHELTSDKVDVKFFGKTEYLMDKMFAMSKDALFIKLCDRYQNLSDFYRASTRFNKKYYLETNLIIQSLYDERHLEDRHMRIIEQIEVLLDRIKMFI